MSLFNQILNAIDSPTQEGNTSQISGILNTVQQLSASKQIDPSTLPSIMSIVGNFTRSALAEKRQTGGTEQVQQIVNQFGGTQANDGVVGALFSNPQLQNLLQEIENRTGVDRATVQSMLPTLVPLALNFLKTGNNTQNPGAQSNSVLNSFLDADGDGDVDLGDALQMAGKYLNK